MSLRKERYRDRLVDEHLARYLRIFGAVVIEGPKWCGKTWTGLNSANSVAYLTEKSVRNNAMIDAKYIFTKERPQLIDEWQVVPEIWDAVRNECDSDHYKGKFILTGSTSLEKREEETPIFHTGTGRIASLRMYPMSLYESGDSTGEASLSGMLAGEIREGFVRNISLEEIAKLLIRGGWPANIDMESENIGVIPESYIEALVTKDMHERQDRKRSPRKMRMVLRALARNESSIAGDKTLLRDIEEYETGEELVESRQTVADYMGVLESLFMVANQEAFSVNYRSSARVGKSPKRHLVDPSLSCACLNLDVEKLLNDHETFGLMFEALVERDLRIYAEHLQGRLYHFRDNVSGDEVDAIVEFKSGEYAAIEIKLSDGNVKDAIRSLKKFYDNVKKKPQYMCVIVGHLDAVMRDPESDVFIVPITSLRP